MNRVNIVPGGSIAKIISILSQTYGDPFLNNQRNPIDEAVFILLSEKTDESKCLKAFHRLKAHFTSWDDILKSSNTKIKQCIKMAGMGERRAHLLKKLLESIKKRFGKLDLSSLAFMELEVAEAELLKFPGIGRKTARCILLYCFEFPVLPVDIHTYRLAIRLGILSRRVSYEISHKVLPQRIPVKLHRAFHVNAVAHGRSRCFAQSPKCQECLLTGYCSYPKAIIPLPVGVRPPPLAIELFSGTGGLSVGFKKAGFHVAQAIENDPHAASTYRRNHPTVDLLERDIRKINPIECLERLGLRPGDVTALIGGPPCQGFSESNRRTRTLANQHNHLYKEYLRFLEVINPAWFVIENVAGLRSLKKGVILERIVLGAKALGYSVEWSELNAANYGVPQLRRRLFIVGTRTRVTPILPEPTHGPKLKPYVTVRKAINDLPLLKNGASTNYLPYREIPKRKLSDYQRAIRNGVNGNCTVQGNLVSRNEDKVIERYKHIGPGDNWEAIPSRLMDNYEDSSRCHTGIYYRLKWDKPAKVIGNFRKNMLIHPSQDRGLSVREAARLQSFPDDYIFQGSIGFQQQQVADAVPPMLAEAVATSILAAAQNDKRSF